MRPATIHAFTVDVEDWAHGIPVTEAVRARLPARLDRGLGRLLDLLTEHRVRGTFFLLGPVVLAQPELARRIVAMGHEIGCHGWSHDLLYTMAPERFRTETQMALEAIRQVTGQAVRAYRAAYFSITRRSLWALDILAELGFRYDSSVIPVRNWRYGIPGFNPYPHVVHTASGPIYEFPISVRPILGQMLPVAGGAYFRIYPYALTSANFRWAERQNRPAVFYLHPWELDPDHPRISFDWRARATHYVNLRRTVPRLTRLLTDFKFASLGEVLEREVA
jgi:polysaccharide deacetylase family protein (PEP-CTERM system associated)